MNEGGIVVDRGMRSVAHAHAVAPRRLTKDDEDGRRGKNFGQNKVKHPNLKKVRNFGGGGEFRGEGVLRLTKDDVDGRRGHNFGENKVNENSLRGG